MNQELHPFLGIIGESKNSYLLQLEDGRIWINKLFVRPFEGLYDPEGFDWQLNRALARQELEEQRNRLLREWGQD